MEEKKKISSWGAIVSVTTNTANENASSGLWHTEKGKKGAKKKRKEKEAGLIAISSLPLQHVAGSMSPDCT